MPDSRKLTLALALLAAATLRAGAVQAALFDRGGGLIYDDALDITWLADANYARTSGYDADGRMDFSAANSWAAGLSYGGYDDWRLPTALNRDGSGPCISESDGDCTRSEMGHMFFNNLGATAGSGILSGANSANLALFANLVNHIYWSSTEFVSKDEPPEYSGWYFDTGIGRQDFETPTDEYYAWAVRPGDVAVIVPTTVPEPETYLLLLAGLGLLGAVARRRAMPARIDFPSTR